MLKIFQKRRPNTLAAKSILNVLDQSAEAYIFPMLDNGYVYLAASRLALFRSAEHWAIVFEVFGYSPRAGLPDLSVITISSKLNARNKPSDYVSDEAYTSYLKNNPFWEMRTFWPISNEDWLDKDNPELVAKDGKIILRGQPKDIPQPSAYAAKGVTLGECQPAVFELCRYLAHDNLDALLATETERRVSILPEMEQIMLLDEWHHPDLANGQSPSQTQSFQRLASVLEKNAPELYGASRPANNHWGNWPEGGTL